MQPWTREELHRLAPPPRKRNETDKRPEIHAAYVTTLVESWGYLVENGFNTPLRLSHLLATALHETGGLTIVREHCTWTWEQMCRLWPQRFRATDLVMRARYMACRGYEDKLAELAYGGWNDLGQRLGNTEAGDGYRYRGGSWLQGTGRDWYREAGRAIGVDLEGDPGLVENPSTALWIAVWYWRKHGLHDLADRNCLRAIQCQINRGNPYSKHEPNGWASRQQWFVRTWDIIGRGQPLPTSDSIGIGASGPDVVAAQNRLRELGYPCGPADGVWGPECRRAIAAFKADAIAGGSGPLEPGDVVGPATRAALAAARPISRPERERMSLADLLASGSTEAKAGVNALRAGRGLVALGLTGAAVGSGGEAPPQPLPVPGNPAMALEQTLGWVPQARAMMVPVIDAMQWALKHWWWVVAISFGVWMYLKGQHVIRARLEAARRGLNLWR